MSRGRLTGQPFDPEDTGPIYQAVANVDDRGRVKLPAGIVEGVTWLRGHDTLAVLAVPGLVRLHPWAIDGEAVLRRRRELSKRAKSEPATFEILRALEDRYKRFRIPPSVRPTLT